MKVLISPGYGAGWSTWHYDNNLATDKRLIELFENGCTKEEMEEACIKYGYTDLYGGPPYMGGFSQLEIRNVPKGCLFQIREYDGSEYVEIFNPDAYIKAED